MTPNEASQIVATVIGERVGDNPGAVAGILEALGDDINTAVAAAVVEGENAGDDPTGLEVRARLATFRVLDRNRPAVDSHRAIASRKEIERVSFLQSGGTATEFEKAWPVMRQRIIEGRMEADRPPGRYASL